MFKTASYFSGLFFLRFLALNRETQISGLIYVFIGPKAIFQIWKYQVLKALLYALINLYY